MKQSITLNVPLNRVEGDLEIRVHLKDGVVEDAWSSGTLFRGFERLMEGREPLDALVITPRICGICTISHLHASVLALENMVHAEIPSNAHRLRNVASLIEHIQSDIRHGFIYFMSDFVNPMYHESSFFTEAVRRYEPLKGESVLQALDQSKRLVDILILLGGKWPHSSFMVPGGLATLVHTDILAEALVIVRSFKAWYEKRVLGCSLEQWKSITKLDELLSFYEENHTGPAQSDVGFYIRMAREAGLHMIGKGYGYFISFGGLTIPDDSEVRIFSGSDQTLLRSGIFREGVIEQFDQKEITEDITSSWFHDETPVRHPLEGRTIPYASGFDGGKYSWAKAPRYQNKPMETGPLAQMLINEVPLFRDIVEKEGASAFVRELARLTRPVWFIRAVEQLLEEALRTPGKAYQGIDGFHDGEGFGLLDATRGALGHWVRIRNGTIESYQIITPTAWNASPRDRMGQRGPWEEALIGTPVRDEKNPVEVGHVIRSFDACLVCTVHAFQSRQKTKYSWILK